MLLSWTNDLSSSLLVKQFYDWKSHIVFQRTFSGFLVYFILFFFGGGFPRGLAVIKPDLSRNLFKPAAAAENYLASRN